MAANYGRGLAIEEETQICRFEWSVRRILRYPRLQAVALPVVQRVEDEAIRRPRVHTHIFF